MAYTNKGPGDSDTWDGYYGHPNDPRRPPDPEDFDDDQDAPIYEVDVEFPCLECKRIYKRAKWTYSTPQPSKTTQSHGFCPDCTPIVKERMRKQ